MRRLAVSIALCAALAGCGAADRASPQAPPKDAGHIHGLGVDPGDGALYIATHAGLFRAAASATAAERVGDSRQDTMGFTVTETGEFLGSGHPDARSDDPPMLGLISSRDQGRSWQPVSLRGQADFHVLRTAGTRLYGSDSMSGRLMVSDDGGRTWAARIPPAPVVDVAADPRDPDVLLVATDGGLAISRDAGKRWRPLNGPAGLLAWPAVGRLVTVDGTGAVWRAEEPGGRWRPVADVGGRPAALVDREGELYVGLHDGSVKRSKDGGLTWALRARV